MCAIVGVSTDKPNVCLTLYNAMTVLQHRGQDAAGIATLDKSKMHLHKGIGLVAEVFKTDKSKINLTGKLGIGHVRYPTAGSNNANDSQQPGQESCPISS